MTSSSEPRKIAPGPQTENPGLPQGIGSWNGRLASIFFLVSDGIRTGGGQVDGGDGKKY